MSDPVPSADIIDKFRAVELDKFDSHLLLMLIAFLCGHLTAILLWRTNVKDYENIVSWLIAGIVALALLYVAGARVKRVRQPKPKPNTSQPVETKP